MVIDLTKLFAPLLLVLALYVAPSIAAETDLRDLNTHCPFKPPATLEAWQARAADLRLQLQVSLGLFPQPELDPVAPQIYGAVERDGYTIEKVTFESLPGFFVTGNLYRPTKRTDKAPGILCPHGHWSDARFYEASSKDVKNYLATGAERFETAAINHIQARCVQLARMGCVVFHWDMIGYCDSIQISFDRAHRFASQDRAAEVNESGWLLFSPAAEVRCQSVMGLQALATSRAVDMLLTLSEVDASKIAITGASGGGTQSFIGAALDPRISVAFPAVMVSTGMQGGCTCENACLLRTGSGNVEMAGLIAPRPLGLTAANDWTKTMPNDGYPELKKLYSLFSADSSVELFPAIHFGHNFNHVSRTNMYGWMNKHLDLGLEMPVLERDFKLARRDELSVWDEGHPKPEAGIKFERKLMKLWSDISDAQLEGLRVGDNAQTEKLYRTLRDGWRTTLGLTTNMPNQIECKAVPLQKDASPKTLIMVGADAYSLEYSRPSATLVSNPRLAAAYTFGYNPTQFVRESKALASTITKLKNSTDQVIKINASGREAAVVAAALFCINESGANVSERLEVQLDLDGFRFAQAENIKDNSFVPGSVKYLDVPGLLSCTPGKVQLTVSAVEPFQRLAAVMKHSGANPQLALRK